MALDFSFDEIKDSSLYKEYVKLSLTYQNYLDQSVPHTFYRWVGFGILLLVFIIRIIVVQGWYIICYALGIYLLSLFLAFLTPKFDPSLEQEMKNENIEEGFQEDTADDQEFRPFIRRLPEFKFWYNATRAASVSFLTTFFSIFDIPVFWPILLAYFVMLFALTMRKQIQHMIKYKYLPFDFGKTKYRK